EAALAVEHRGVCELADAVRADALEELERIAAAHQQLAERGLVENADAVADGELLLDERGEPVRAPERVLHRRAEVVRALPAELRAELGAFASQRGIQRRNAQRTAG